MKERNIWEGKDFHKQCFIHFILIIFKYEVAIIILKMERLRLTNIWCTLKFLYRQKLVRGLKLIFLAPFIRIPLRLTPAAHREPYFTV